MGQFDSVRWAVLRLRTDSAGLVRGDHLVSWEPVCERVVGVAAWVRVYGLSGVWPLRGCCGGGVRSGSGLCLGGHAIGPPEAAGVEGYAGYQAHEAWEAAEQEVQRMHVQGGGHEEA